MQGILKDLSKKYLIHLAGLQTSTLLHGKNDRGSNIWKILLSYDTEFVERLTLKQLNKLTPDRPRLWKISASEIKKLTKNKKIYRLWWISKITYRYTKGFYHGKGPIL